MCECFDCDPAWQGWEHWYFGRDPDVESGEPSPPPWPGDAAAGLRQRLAEREPALPW